MKTNKLLILAGLHVLTVAAQAQSYVIGTGTVTTQYPFPTGFSDARTQMLYTASEIIASGYPSGAHIGKIGFHLNAVPADAITAISVSLKNYAGISLVGFQTGMTPVFTGDFDTPAPGWQDITLQTPFLWDGSSSLLVEICFDHASGTTNAMVMAQFAINRIKVATQNYGNGCSLSNASSYSYRPNIRLAIAPPLPALNPFPAIGATTQHTSLAWSPGSGLTTGYKVYAGITNPPLNLVYEGPSAYCQPGLLTENTHYYWKVVPGNPAGDALNCPVWDFYTAGLDTALAAYYPFRGNALDESGKANHGHILGASPTFDKHGKPNAAMLFNGNSQIRVNPSASLQLTSWTICGWFRSNSVPALQAALTAKDRNAAGSCNYATSIDNDLKFSGSYHSCSGTLSSVLSSPLSAGEWYHYAYSRDGVSHVIKLFINGIQLDTVFTTIEPCVEQDTLRMGAWRVWNGGYPSVSNFFSGTLDNIRIYNVSLSAEEILEIFESENCSTPFPYYMTVSWTPSGDLTLGLNGSEPGVSYRVKRGMVSVGDSVPGTGATISLGTFTVPGTYYVVASNACGITQMFGSAMLPGIPLLVSLGPDVQVCGGTAVQLAASVEGSNPPYTFQWSNGSAEGPEITLVPVESGSISVTVTDAAGYAATAQVTITVFPLPGVTWPGILPGVCIDAPPFLLTGAAPAGGTYSGAGVSEGIFHPALAGSGTTLLTYAFQDQNGCSDTAFNTMTVNDLPVVGWTGPLSPQCVSATSCTLSGGYPEGGVYLGPGVTGTNFNASVAGVGTSTLSYTFTDNNGCSGTAWQTVVVYDLPSVSWIVTLPDQCANSNTCILSGGLPSGGTFGGPGVTGNNFQAAGLNAGTYTLTYTFTDVNGCSDTAYNPITVNSLPLVFWTTVLDPQCVSATYYQLTGGDPPGGIYSGPGIEGDGFNASSVGTGTFLLAYVYVDENTCMNSALNQIIVHPLPVADAGDDITVTEGTSVTLSGTAAGGIPPYLYSWTPAELLDNPFVPDPATVPLSDTTVFTLQVTDQRNCTSLPDAMTVFTESPPAFLSLQGTLTYDNPAQTAMNNAVVLLKQGTDIIGQSPTDNQGHYAFVNLTPGLYTLAGQTTKAWGGSNALDALRIQRHFVGLNYLAGLGLKAADVNNSGGINSNDALLVMKRFVNIISSFPSGDWAFEEPAVQPDGINTVTQDMKALCFGDVDGSYTPPLARKSPEVYLKQEGELLPDQSGRFALPFSFKEDTEIGALSLIFLFDVQALEFTGVEMPREGTLLFNASGRELRLAWYSLIPANVKEGQPLFSLRFRMKHRFAEPRMPELCPESGIGDASGHELQDVTLCCPAVILQTKPCSLGQNHPNPFTAGTKIPYYLDKEGFVEISILNALGQVVAILVDAYQAKGSYQVDWNHSGKAGGIYTCRMRFRDDSGIIQTYKTLCAMQSER